MVVAYALIPGLWTQRKTNFWVQREPRLQRSSGTARVNTEKPCLKKRKTKQNTIETYKTRKHFVSKLTTCKCFKVYFVHKNSKISCKKLWTQQSMEVLKNLKLARFGSPCLEYISIYKLRQDNYHKFKACLSYIANFRILWSTVLSCQKEKGKRREKNCKHFKYR